MEFALRETKRCRTLTRNQTYNYTIIFATRLYPVSRQAAYDLSELMEKSRFEVKFESPKVDAKKNDINQFKRDCENVKTAYTEILTNTKINNIEDYKILEKIVKSKVEIIDKLIDNSKKLLAKLKEFEDANMGAVIEANFNKVMTSRIEKIIYRPTQYRTDEVLMDIITKKKKDVQCAKEVNVIPVQLIVNGGVKIDFSTGIVFNIGRSYFFNQTYRYDSVYFSNGTLADSVYIKRNRNNNVVVPSLGAFFHVYSQLNSHFNLGGTVGASLGSDQRAYVHAGGNILIGKSDRVIIGAGISIATSKILYSRYEEGQQIKRSAAPTEILIEDASRIGGFISLTWNLNLIK